MNTTSFVTSTSTPQVGILDSDRREFERMPPQDPSATAILRDPLAQSAQSVRVVDQSRGGLRVLLEDDQHPSVGSTVGIEFNGTIRPATVRWVLSKRERGWRVGLQWLD